MTDTYRTTPGPLKPGECVRTHYGRVRQGDGWYYYEERTSDPRHPWRADGVGHKKRGTYVIPEPKPEEPQDEIEVVLVTSPEQAVEAAYQEAVTKRALTLAIKKNERAGQLHVDRAKEQIIRDQEVMTAQVQFTIRRKA